jgi:tripartite-type tricarboxylate transporter receptor subunit TctC
MTKKMRGLFTIMAACVAGIGINQAAAASSGASGFPKQPIHLVIPYSPGGQTDATARMFAEQVGKEIGQRVVAENKTGAGGAVAAGLVARAQPDGYTIMIGGVGTHLLPLIRSSTSYDADKDLRPVAMITSAPLLLVVKADAPYKNLDELIAKGKTSSLNYGSSGVGTTPHLASAWLTAETGISTVHVPYRGGGELIKAVMGGEVDFVIDPVLSTLPQVKAGTMRTLGATSASALDELARIPLVGDRVPGYDVSSWLGIYVPAATPDEVVKKLEAAFKAAANSPELQEKLNKMGNPERFKSEAEFKEFIATQTKKYKEIIDQQNIRID